MEYQSSNCFRLLLLFTACFGGCSYRSSGVTIPKWDPDSVVERALSEYDSSKDQKLSRDELQNCPGLAAAIELFDLDHDGALSREELASKLKDIHDHQAAMVEVSCTVVRNGQPLEGATVTFVPEPFMGEAFQPMSGITGRDGVAFPSVPEAELPAEFRGKLHGVRCGIYRITVSHPTVHVPAKYNSQTELGRTVALRMREPVLVSF